MDKEGQRSLQIVTAILGSLESLIQSQVDHQNHEFMIELQRLVGSMFQRADTCLRNDLMWKDLHDVEGITPNERRLH